MENTKLNRVFDQVKLSREREEAMLADLLNEKKEVSGMKQTNSRRRIPAAALVAAVLVAVLAGSAIAVGHFGQVDVVPREQDIHGNAGSSYNVYGNYDRIQAESLSEEVWAYGKDSGEYDAVDLPFDSWRECTAFLGLDLGGNSILEQLPQGKGGIYFEGEIVPNLMHIGYAEETPVVIRIISSYAGENYSVEEDVTLRTEENYISGEDMRMNTYGEVTYEDYVTPGGMAVKIIIDDMREAEFRTIRYIAHFSKDNALYMLDFSPYIEKPNPGGLDELKAILDAYE